jgi:hypothetical protein
MVCGPIDQSPIASDILIHERLGADKTNIAMQQILNGVDEVKCDVVEVKRDVEEAKCL